MKSIEEVRDYLLKNRVNEDGNLDLSGLDFSDFDGSVYIGDMKVKNSLFQNWQQVGRTLSQNWQQVAEDLFQDRQQVGKDLFSHKLEDNEKWEDHETCVKRVKRIKKLKPITKKELAELGYELV